MDLKKAVIPVAGLGVRFLPATKSVPKELFPLVDEPILLSIVREAVQAGIQDIILVTNQNKKGIENFFKPNEFLEEHLLKTGKQAFYEKLKEIQNMANFIFAPQDKAKGLGNAVHCAMPYIGQNNFALLLGDEIMISEGKNVTSQLKDLHQKTQSSCVAVMKVPISEVSKYGIIKIENPETRPMKVLSVVEKPEPQEAPSPWALPGRYLFTSSVFESLRDLKPGKNGEIQLTDGMSLLAQKEELYATEFTAQRYDAGSKLGYLKANIEMGLKHPEIGEALREYLRKKDFS